jgi:hypothetical protein
MSAPDAYLRFRKVFDECLEKLGGHRLQFPLYWVALGPRGVMLKGRYTDVGKPRPESVFEGEPFPAESLPFPLHYLVVDAAGKGALIVVRSFSVIELLGCG